MHTTDFDHGTTKETSKCTTSDALTTPSEMSSYSSLEIFTTDAMSSTPQKLAQLSTTTAGNLMNIKHYVMAAKSFRTGVLEGNQKI